MASDVPHMLPTMISKRSRLASFHWPMITKPVELARLLAAAAADA